MTTMKPDSKKDMMWRINLIYFGVVFIALAIIVKVCIIQIIEGDKWREKAESLTTKILEINAHRGNIYASDGSLMATSIPIYEVRMDLNTEALSDNLFFKEIDSLSICLSGLYPDKSPSQFKRELELARKNGARYHLIRKNVRYNELKKLRTFPLFRKGRYKGGLIYVQQNKRELPFKALAARTVGYDRENIKPVGLEGAYRDQLQGVTGKRLMQKIAGGIWMPINDKNEVEPEDGNDLITTIDINIQDVAESALLRQLELQEADHGCVVVMEVKTGYVKAIANLKKNKNGKYGEYYNYAVGESTEPGSTFKLMALIAAFEDNLIQPEDSIDTGNGTFKFYDQVMRDSHYGGYGKITVKKAFSHSSNVGISRIINEGYSSNPQLFIDRLYKMNLNKPLGIKIAGEGKPEIKSTGDQGWSGVSLPWMSIGYEVRMTPLQILTFYNAIANDGKMVKPMFVKQIKKKGQSVRSFETEVINSSVCSRQTIEKVKSLLKEVVETGTGRNLKNANFSIAGKTGTAQIANDKYGYEYESKVSHQASFAGYFPADNPKYSCIVVVNAPSKNVYYGNLVAGPIFKEIADKVYSTSIDIHRTLELREPAALTHVPYTKNGKSEPLIHVLNTLNISIQDESAGNPYSIASANQNSVKIQTRLVQSNQIPNVIGMSARDALFILENLGLNVWIEGKGAVSDQSISAGARFNKGDIIRISLI